MDNVAHPKREVIGPIRREGRWLVDSTGRSVQFRGINLMRRLPPFLPEPFGEDDARWLADQGFNSARLGIIYEAVEPRIDEYDDTYIRRMVGYSRLLADHGFFNTIDFHQDVFNSKFGGDGFPDWALPEAPGLEALWNQVASTVDGLDCALLRFLVQQEVNPVLHRAWDDFWSNVEQSNGRGLQDQFILAWTRVLIAFADEQHRLLGYSPLNEPVIGNLTAPLGDHMELQRAPFYRRWLKAAREIDPDGLVYLFSTIISAADNGKTDADNARYLAGALQDSGLAFERHHYGGSLTGQGEEEQRAQYEEDDALARELGMPFVVNEFSASDDNDNNRRDVDFADERFLSWMLWSYYAEGEICCPESGLLLDDSQPASDENVKPGKADALITPYPQAVAGTPLAYHFDRASRTMTLEYSTQPVGGTLDPSVPTVIFMPRRVYPTGYVAEVHGARITSSSTSPWLELVSEQGAETVSVRVSPATDSSVDLPSQIARR